jgi:hypothetical protein
MPAVFPRPPSGPPPLATNAERRGLRPALRSASTILGQLLTSTRARLRPDDPRSPAIDRALTAFGNALLTELDARGLLNEVPEPEQGEPSK